MVNEVLCQPRRTSPGRTGFVTNTMWLPPFQNRIKCRRLCATTIILVTFNLSSANALNLVQLNMLSLYKSESLRVKKKDKMPLYVDRK